ncbi:MAG: hypothetical protein AAF497_28875, partial [Planctomycetota bacterium]
RYLVLAATIPLVSLFILSTWGRAENRQVLSILSAGGLALFAIAFGLARLVQSKIKLLRKVASIKKMTR